MVRTTKPRRQAGPTDTGLAQPSGSAQAALPSGLLRPTRPGRRSSGASENARSGRFAWIARKLPPWESRRDRRALRAWYATAELPLFGLPTDWTGYRCPGQRAGRQVTRRAGPFGMFVRPSGPLWVAALGLTHIAGDGGLLHVGSRRVTNYQVVEAMAVGNFCRRLAWPLLEQYGHEAFEEAVIARRAQFRSGQLTWRHVVIPVEEHAVNFRVLAVGRQWVGLATIGSFCVQLDARQFPVGRVRLVRIRDPGRYLSSR